MSDGPKSVVPVPVGTHVDHALVRRITEGCRTGGTDGVRVIGAEPSADPPIRTRRLAPLGAIESEMIGLAPPVLLAAGDLRGTVLFPEPGYALVAGTPQFLRGAAPERVDEGRVCFAGYARAVEGRLPILRSVAQSLPPRYIAWSRARDIRPETGAAQQLGLMHTFVAGECAGPDFARGWLAARRLSQDNGERLRDPLTKALDGVFCLLKDYSIDPDLKDPETCRTTS
ncbi:hypothetical protein ACIRQP_08745 [Streptomyces sp. NPDC102274]|uniref:hypothetical protein n=1 Tax=Streptomyces sp. NPDC102274 TaxID=3366151 RepID=UPI00381BFF75